MLAEPPVAARAEGSTIWDVDGKACLDAAGGAVVVNVGHGRRGVAEVMADQASRLAYAHGSFFTNEPLERYAAELGPLVPLDEPAVYPVSGGSEAIETALKQARAYHLARREPDRLVVIARWSSYHGNTLGALDLSGRRPLRRPYEPWLGRFRHVSAAYPYRAGVLTAGASSLSVSLWPVSDEGTRATSDPASVLAHVADPSCGAVVLFLGTVRDHSPGIDRVTHLEYEAYGGVVEEKIADAAGKFATAKKTGKPGRSAA